MEVTIILLALGIIGYVTYQSSPSIKYKKAISHFELCQWNEAIKILDLLFNKHTEAPAKLAECKLHQGLDIKTTNENEALGFFNEVLEIKNRLPSNATKESYELIEAKAFFEIAKINFENALSVTNSENRIKKIKENLQFIEGAKQVGIKNDFINLINKHVFELAENNFILGTKSEKTEKFDEAIRHYKTAKDLGAK